MAFRWARQGLKEADMLNVAYTFVGGDASCTGPTSRLASYVFPMPQVPLPSCTFLLPSCGFLLVSVCASKPNALSLNSLKHNFPADSIGGGDPAHLHALSARGASVAHPSLAPWLSVGV